METERAGSINLNIPSDAALLRHVWQAEGVISDPVTEAEKKAGSDALRGKPGLSTISLLLVEMIVGYEWLVSGVVKFVRGGFPSGLAAELLEKSLKAPAWYSGLMKSIFIPNAQFLGYVIEISEVLAGVALVVGPFLWLCAWDRVSDRVRALILLMIAVAAIGATFLAINLHLANGAAHAWLIPESGFDEGIDLDSVLPAIQIVIATVSIMFLRRLHRNRPVKIAAAPQVAHTE